MLVGIGSRNPVKIKAVKKVFKKVWPKAGFKALAVVSGVADQPIGQEETIKGAKQRAKKVLEIILKRKGEEEVFGVGVEGGNMEIEGTWYTVAWGAIVNRKGETGLGGGAIMPLPRAVGERIAQGEELGPVMDDWTSRQEVKKKEGAIGVLTKGIVTRQEAYEQIISFALVKFLNRKSYG